MAPAGIDGGDEAVHKASHPKSSSRVTLCWSKPDSNSRSHPLTRRQTHGSDRMNGAERDTVVGSGSLVTLDPGAAKREIARLFRSDRGHYRRREAHDPQRLQRGRGFVHVKARQAFPGNWPPSSSTRTNGGSGFAMAASVLSRGCQTHQLHPSCGTE